MREGGFHPVAVFQSSRHRVHRRRDLSELVVAMYGNRRIEIAFADSVNGRV